MTILLYLMTCLMSPSPLINLAESRVNETLQMDIMPAVSQLLFEFI
jgi:hypothetical protein